ncbi:Uma2 family endonuclease [Methylomagnum sp.]
MVAVLQNPPVQMPHFKLTVDDFYRMGEAGIFKADDRIELIEGELIDMAPIGSFHAGLNNRISRWMARLLGDKATPWTQSPIRLSRNSAPQPDFALLRYRSDDYAKSLPTAADVLLLVEVADSTIRSDREVKAPLYARHGVPEYWLIDLPTRCIEVYLDPVGGRYQTVRTVESGLLAPSAFPEATLDVGEFFGV